MEDADFFVFCWLSLRLLGYVKGCVAVNIAHLESSRSSITLRASCCCVNCKISTPRLINCKLHFERNVVVKSKLWCVTFLVVCSCIIQACFGWLILYVVGHFVPNICIVIVTTTITRFTPHQVMPSRLHHQPFTNNHILITTRTLLCSRRYQI